MIVRHRSLMSANQGKPVYSLQSKFLAQKLSRQTRLFFESEHSADMQATHVCATHEADNPGLPSALGGAAKDAREVLQ